MAWRVAPRVVVGLSGGVDSSVAALLLLRQGYDVTGVFMRNWDPQDETAGACDMLRDLADARKVASHLGIPFRELNFVKEYWTRVFVDALAGFERGVTPNPDTACNSQVKFGAFLHTARDKLRADYIATGHYARIGASADGSPLLMRALDPSKDQTYFLSGVPSTALRHSLFPVGELLKSQVRELAAEAGLPTATKAESMGICFIGERNFPEFLDRYLVQQPGPFVSVETGEVIATHRGMASYTVGQKARIGGQPIKWYVVDKDAATNTVLVAPGGSHPALYSYGASSSTFSWVAGSPPAALQSGSKATLALYGQHRYLLAAEPCTVSIDSATAAVRARWKQPQRAITRGQQLVLYDGDVCLGGGPIDYIEPTLYAQQQAAQTDEEDL